MARLRLVFFASVSAVLIGCAGGATREGMVYQPDAALGFDRALDNAVAVGRVSGGQKTNPLWTSEIGNEAFADALKATLEGLGLWSDTGRYQLRVELQEVDQPAFGFDMTVTTRVNYQLIDSQRNSIVLNETVVAEFTATVDDAFAGVKRLRLANEGSVRKSIGELVKLLSLLEISGAQVSLAI